MKSSILKFRNLTWVSATLVLFSCRHGQNEKPYQETVFLMDTVFQISIYDKESPALLRADMDSAFSSIRRLEALVSAYVDSSDLNRLRRAPAGTWVAVSMPTQILLKKSLETSEKTGGAFDFTLGGIMEAWGFGTDRHRIPSDEEIRALLALTGVRHIRMRDGCVLRDDTCRLDLGGIAKGYAVDEAAAVLKRRGIRNALINAGGQVIAFGHPPGRQTWRIGVRHPRADSMIAVIETGEASIATAGDYERYFIENGVRYHHIMDPATGRPARSGVVSVTVLAADGITADAYDTPIFVMGPEKGMRFIESNPELEGMILYEDHGVLRHLVSSGLRKKIRFLDGEN